MEIELSPNLEAMLVSAERYALGRRTYIVSETVDYLIPLIPNLSDGCLQTIISDLENKIRYGVGSYGDACDYQDWERLWAEIGIELKKRDGCKEEIIRCKDCKHSEPWYGDKSRCFLWAEDGIGVFNDGFCSYARKKENDG